MRFTQIRVLSLTVFLTFLLNAHGLSLNSALRKRNSTYEHIAGCGGQGYTLRKSWILRTPNWALHTVLHRVLGAFLLLRNPSTPRALHVSGTRRWRLRHRAKSGVRDRRHLCSECLPCFVAGRLGGGPAIGFATRHHAWRRLDFAGPHFDRSFSFCALETAVLRRSHSHRPWHGLVEAKHLRDCRRSVSRGWRAPRCGFLDLLHGYQQRRRSWSTPDRVVGRNYWLALGFWHCWCGNVDWPRVVCVKRTADAGKSRRRNLARSRSSQASASGTTNKNCGRNRAGAARAGYCSRRNWNSPTRPAGHRQKHDLRAGWHGSPVLRVRVWVWWLEPRREETRAGHRNPVFLCRDFLGRLRTGAYLTQSVCARFHAARLFRLDYPCHLVSGN